MPCPSPNSSRWSSPVKTRATAEDNSLCLKKPDSSHTFTSSWTRPVASPTSYRTSSALRAGSNFKSSSGCPWSARVPARSLRKRGRSRRITPCLRGTPVSSKWLRMTVSMPMGTVGCSALSKGAFTVTGRTVMTVRCHLMTRSP